MKNFILFFIFIILQPSIAQWESCNKGLFVGLVTCIHSFNNNVVIGTQNGIFLSTDYGYNWLPKSNKQELIQANSITSVGNDVFVGSSLGGILVSTDKGENWLKFDSSTVNFHVKTFAVRDTIIFAGTSSNGVNISTNKGKNWIERNVGLTSKSISAIQFNGSNIFVGTTTGGVFFSNNNGENWIEKNYGLTNAKISAMALIKSSLFVATDDGKLFKSSNNGENWEIISNWKGYHISSIAANDSVILLGSGNGAIFRSNDLGNTWKWINQESRTRDIHCLTFNGKFLYAGTEWDGINLSTDYGDTWIQTGTETRHFNTFIVKDDIIFAGGPGVFISTNNGDKWSARNPAYSAYDITLFYKKGNSIVAISQDYNKFFISTDNGTKWSDYSSKIPIGSVAYVDKSIFAASGNRIFISEDEGESWTQTNFNLPDDYIKSIVSNGNRLFVGTNNRGIFLSDDLGISWIESNTGLTNLYILSIAVLNNRIFAGTYTGGIFMSTDNGSTWVNNRLIGRSIISFGAAGKNILAGSIGAGLYISTDFGITWIYSGFAQTTIRSFLNYSNYIYATTSDQGIIRAKISELTSINDNKITTDINSISPNPASDFIEILLSENWKFSESLKIVIMNIFGQTVSTPVCTADTPASGGQRIDVSGLAPGMYFVKIGDKVCKFVKL